MVNTPESVPRTESPAAGFLSFEIANLQGVGTRERQEDSFSILNAFDPEKARQKGFGFLVCDGMGGMKDGKVASETAIQSLRAYLDQLDMNGDIHDQLSRTIYAASSDVERILGGEGGSTLILGLIYHEHMYFASVGDSFLYLFRDGMLYQMNCFHTMKNDIYRDIIGEDTWNLDAARNHPEAPALSSFLGMTGLENIEVCHRSLPLKRGDTIMACSDGVAGTLSEAEIMQALSVAEISNIPAILENGIISYRKPNQDNYTAVILRCV